MLASNDPDLAVWDQLAVAAARGDCERDGQALVKEFVDARAESLQLVARLQPGDLTQAGQHPDIGGLTVRDVLVEWVYHDRDHVRQIPDIVQTMVWPEMGHAQRFYQSAE